MSSQVKVSGSLLAVNWPGQTALVLNALAAAAVVVGALDYQSSVMFYLAGVAAGVGRRLVASDRTPFAWLVAHAGVLVAAAG